MSIVMNFQMTKSSMMSYQVPSLFVRSELLFAALKQELIDALTEAERVRFLIDFH